MKVKLLKKLRRKGRESIEVLSITTEESFSDKKTTGMSYSYSGIEYRGLFTLGDSIEDVRNKACKIWFENNIEHIRVKYKRYKRSTHKN